MNYDDISWYRCHYFTKLILLLVDLSQSAIDTPEFICLEIKVKKGKVIPVLN
jgi:hypothetical protein